MNRLLPKNLLSDSLYENLRDRIIAADIKAGEKLRILEIAKEYGTSQAPVREALARLEQDGLVVSEPYRGTKVVKLSLADIEDILTLRIAMDNIALTRAIPRLTEEQLEVLRNLVSAMQKAAAEGDRVKLAENDIAFHLFICNQAASHILSVTWSSTVTQARWATATANLVSDPRNLEDIAAFHVAIFDAIVRRDIPLALETNRAHLDFAFTHILDDARKKEIESSASAVDAN